MFAVRNPGTNQLAASGPVISVLVRGPKGAVNTLALIDTGSSISSVDVGLLSQIGALPAGTRSVTTIEAQPIQVQEETGIQILSDDGQDIFGPIPVVLADHLPAPVQVLIGRDGLSGVELSYDGAAGAWAIIKAGDRITVAPRHFFLLGLFGSAVAGITSGLIWRSTMGPGRDRENRRG